MTQAEAIRGERMSRRAFLFEGESFGLLQLPSTSWHRRRERAQEKKNKSEVVISDVLGKASCESLCLYTSMADMAALILFFFSGSLSFETCFSNRSLFVSFGNSLASVCWIHKEIAMVSTPVIRGIPTCLNKQQANYF